MNKAALGPLAERTAEQLGWSGRAVVSVSPETSAIEAMHILNSRRISALAVVDGVGKIIGNFSISEMR
jgi:CBS domain-containing protein